MKYIITSFVCVVCLLIFFCPSPIPTSKECTVYSIEKMQDIRENHTEIYWLVVTDQGTYSIQTNGFWAHPELIGKIKENNKYILTIEGPNIPYLGEYGRITGVELKE